MIEPIPALLAELAVKSTALLGSALLAAVVARRFCAAERHFVWCTAVIGLLVLPVAAVVGPSAAWLPAPRISTPEAGPGLVRDGAARDGGADASGVRGAMTADQPAGAARARRAPPPASALSQSTPPTSPAPTAAAFDAATGAAAAVAAYVLVALLLAARIAVSAVRVHRGLARLEPLTDPRSSAALDHARRENRVERRVRLLASDSDVTPWAWGLLRPTVVVPRGFPRWSGEAQRNALVHELGHVARFDFVTGLAARLCCAAYWFQPLVWVASTRLYEEAERACDDRVLAAGGSGAAYASQLLDLARGLRRDRRPPVPSAAMVRSPSVAQRIALILDADTGRRTMRRSTALCMSIAAAALLLPLAVVESQQPVAPGDPVDALGPPALLQRDPANSGELARTVRTLIEQGRRDEAAKIVTDYVWRRAERPPAPGETLGPGLEEGCAYCVEVLSGFGAAEPDEEMRLVLEALDAAEARAYDNGEGTALVGLAAIFSEPADWHTRSLAHARSLSYLIDAFRIGNLTDPSKFQAAMLLADRGSYEPAKALLMEMHEDPLSRFHGSESIEQWLAYLDLQIDRERELIGTLPTSGSATADRDYWPIYKPMPYYPPEAESRGLEGSVIVEYTVTERGRTKDVHVVESTDPVFHEAAMWAAAQFRYAPRVLGGVEVAVPGVRNKVTFRLGL